MQIKTKEVSVAVIEKGIAPIVRQAEGLNITNPKAMSEAGETLSKLNVFLDKVTEERERVTKPLNEALKAERSRWKPIETLCNEAIEVLRGKMIKYQTEAKKQADAEKARIEDRVGEGKGKLKVETAVRKMDEVETPEESIAGDTGLVKFKTVQKFKVVDMAKLPMNLHLANETEIRRLMTNGVKVEGVEYYQEEVPVNFR